jgi:hypothetical protein
MCPSDSFSILNIGRPLLSNAVAGDQYDIMAALGEAAGIDRANLSESVSNPDESCRSHWLILVINSSSVAGFANPRSGSIGVCMASAICKRLNQNGGHRLLVAAFSAK